MDEIDLSNYVVICKTTNCENGDYKIEVSAPTENPFFICGVCSNQITNIQLIK